MANRLALFAAAITVSLLTLFVPAKAERVHDSSQTVYKIGGDVVPPKVLYKVEPRYTGRARDAKIQGNVLLSVVIETDGHPSHIEIVDVLDDDLDKAAVDAVDQWRFEPATRLSVPVRAAARIEVNFKLKYVEG